MNFRLARSWIQGIVMHSFQATPIRAAIKLSVTSLLSIITVLGSVVDSLI